MAAGQIRNIKPGQTLSFPAEGRYVAMTVTCSAGNLDKPNKKQLANCDVVIEKWDANTALNANRSTMAKTGDDPSKDVRLDNEGTDKTGGKFFAKVRIQAQIRPRYYMFCSKRIAMQSMM